MTNRSSTGQFTVTHGQSRTSLYRLWRTMIDRCDNPKAKAYDRYGGKGIKVCRRWYKFENFYADMGDRPRGTTLDRKNNKLGYSKSNCRWATVSEQLRNRSCTRLIEWRGRSMTVREWSDELGISLRCLRGRFEQGWSAERAFTTKDKVVVPHQFTWNGRTQNLTAWAKELGIKYGTLHARITRQNMAFEEAIKLNRPEV